MTILQAPSSDFLPLDVFEVIVNVLAEDCTTLKALSLVRSDFSDICQRCLFSTIAVPSRDGPRMLEGLVRALTTNHRLAQYVKTLNLYISSDLFNNAQLPWVLNHLPNIQSLLLYTSYDVDWTQYSHQLHSALMCATQSPKLYELQLIGIGPKEVAIALLVRTSNLRHLFLGWGSARTRILTSAEADKDLKISQLKTLGVDADGMGTLEFLLHAKRSNNCYAIDFSQIRRLSMRIDRRERIGTAFELFSRLLCLEDLDIDVCEIYDVSDLMATILKNINSSSTKTLRLLKADLSRFSVSRDPLAGLHDPLAGLPDGLVRMPAGNNLREIFITVTTDEFKHCSSQMDHWGPLAEALGDRSRFTRLERIHVSVESHMRDSTGKELLMEMAEQCFLHLRNIYGTNFKFRAEYHI